MKKLVLLILLSNILLAQKSYTDIHFNSLVVDTHADVLLQVLRGADISRKLDYGHVDLVRLKEGGVGVQVFAVWPNPEVYRESGMFAQSMRMINILKKIIRENPDKISLAISANDIEAARGQGKIAALIGVEGGTAIEDDLAKLDELYKQGARYLGLTWNDSPSWASSAKDEGSSEFTGFRGLTELGKSVISKMNDMGMIVDISHSGEQTFYDVLKTTRAPVIASHSDVYSICPHYRNLKDEQLLALAQNGGVIFLNFYAGYLQAGFDNKYAAVRKESKTYLDSLKSAHENNYLAYRTERNKFFEEQTQAYRPDIAVLVDHMDHVIKLVGEDHVGIGSDFDGISMTPVGIRDVSDMPLLTREMVKRGYTEDRIKKILGGNFMRVFRAVEASRK